MGEIISNLLWTVLIFYIIDFVIYAVRNWRVVLKESDLEKYHNNEETPLLPAQFADREPVTLYAEESSGVIFVYNLTTDEFVAQGKDIEEVSVDFHARHPNKVGYLQDGDAAYVIGLFE